MIVKVYFHRSLQRPVLQIDNVIRLEMNKAGELIVINKMVHPVTLDKNHIRYISVYNNGSALYKIQL